MRKRDYHPMDDLEPMVRQMVKEGFDRIALAKTLRIVDEYLLLSDRHLDGMIDKLINYWGRNG